MCGIYKITNLINGQIYIGQSVNIKERWREERSRAFNPSSAEYKASRSKAFRDFGLENFSFEVIEECPREQLNEREKYWVAYYDSYYNGYNATKGGAGTFWNGMSLTHEQVKKIISYLADTDKTGREIAKEFNINEGSVSSINVGRYWFDDKIQYPIRELKKKKNYCIDCGKEVSQKAIRCLECYSKLYRVVERPSKEDLFKLLIELNGNFTKAAQLYGITDNAVRKWCKSYGLPYHTSNYKPIKKKNLKASKPKPVAQIDIETNEVIKAYDSMNEAYRALKVSSSSHIAEVCNGKRKTAYGYKWKFI